MIIKLLFPRQIQESGDFTSRALGIVGKYRFLRDAILGQISQIGGIISAKQFRNLKKFCLFVGYPRSGHSLIGALIDAHPNAMISHELDVLYFFQKGFSRKQILYMIKRNSIEFSRVGRTWTGYRYDIPGQVQREDKNRLLIMGDKKGGKTIRQLRANPDILEELRREIDLPLYFIHVIRNPFDNISTISRKHAMSLEKSAEFYFSLCQTINNMKERKNPKRFLEFQLESLIENPSKVLRKVTNFLELGLPDNYLSACSSVIFEKPKKTRKERKWRRQLIDEVMERMGNYKFLEGYEYDD